MDSKQELQQTACGFEGKAKQTAKTSASIGQSLELRPATTYLLNSCCIRQVTANLSGIPRSGDLHLAVEYTLNKI